MTETPVAFLAGRPGPRAASEPGLTVEPRSPVDRLSLALVSVSSPNHYTLWNALAVETLAGDIRGMFGQRVDVSIYRLYHDKQLGNLVQALLRVKPDVIGLSVECGGAELSLAVAREVSRRRAETGAGPALVFGGKIPTYFPELFLSAVPSSMVVLGEGELPFRSLVARWLGEDDTPLRSIPNLASMHNGEPSVTTRTAPTCSDLVYPPSVDTVPTLLDIGAGTFLTQSSRGCSWSKCTYCTVPSFRRRERWEPLPWKRTLRHLEELSSLGVREFEFCDDEFLGGRVSENLDRGHQIANDLQSLSNECDGGIAFRVFLIPHTIYQPNDPAGNAKVLRVLRALKTAGLVRVYMGVESGSEAQAKRYCRGTTPQDVAEALQILRGLELGIDCGFIMFDPSTTPDDLRANITYFRQNDLIHHNQWPFRPLIANEGAGYGRLMARRGVPPDPEYMSYAYAFEHPDVQSIFDAVDTLSAETRSLFYALKVVSKTHFDPRRESIESSVARDLVILNGLIYLDLIEELLCAIGAQDAQAARASAVARARHKVGDLVKEAAAALASGQLADPHDRIRQEVSAHVPNV